jgi:hypothetical protein
MHYNYFVASRWRNRDSVFALVDAIRAKGKSAYNFMENDPYHSSDEDPEKVMKGFEATEDWKNTQMVKDIFTKDMEALQASDAVILLLPAGKSAHIEIGVAYGMQKKTILIGEQKEAESLYLIFDEDYPSIDAFIDSLS